MRPTQLLRILGVILFPTNQAHTLQILRSRGLAKSTVNIEKADIGVGQVEATGQVTGQVEGLSTLTRGSSGSGSSESLPAGSPAFSKQESSPSLSLNTHELGSSRDEPPIDTGSSSSEIRPAYNEPEVSSKTNTQGEASPEHADSKHSFHRMKLIDFFPARSETSFAKIAQEVQAKRNMGGGGQPSGFHRDPHAFGSSTNNPSGSTTLPEDEISPPLMSKANEPGSPGHEPSRFPVHPRPPLLEIIPAQTEPHVIPETSAQENTPSKPLESWASTNHGEADSPDRLTNGNQAFQISRLKQFIVRVNKKYFKKIKVWVQRTWETWMGRIRRIASSLHRSFRDVKHLKPHQSALRTYPFRWIKRPGSSVKAPTEAENVMKTSNSRVTGHTFWSKLMDKLRPRRGSGSDSLESRRTSGPSFIWHWLRSLGRKVTDLLFGRGKGLSPSHSSDSSSESSMFHEHQAAHIVRTLKTAPDTRTEQERAGDDEELNLVLEITGQLLAKPPDKITPTTLTNHFLEEWKKHLSEAELGNPAVTAEMKDTAAKFTHLMEAVLANTQAKNILLEFYSGIKQWKRKYLSQLWRALGASTSATVDKTIQSTEQALQELGPTKLTVELQPELRSIVEEIPYSHREIIFNGLSTQKDHSESIFKEENSLEENLVEFLESKIYRSTATEITAFAKSRANYLKSKVSEVYKSKLHGESEDAPRDALTELTVENLEKTLAMEVDLEHEFYLYKIIKAFEEILEPLKKHAANFMQIRLKEQLERALVVPELVARLPEFYEDIMKQITSDKPKRVASDKLFKDIYGLNQNPKQLADKLADSGIKDQIDRVVNDHPSQLTTQEVTKLHVATDASIEEYLKVLEEVDKRCKDRAVLAHFKQLRELPPLKSLPEVLEQAHKSPEVIAALRLITKDSAAGHTIPRILTELVQAGLLTNHEHTRLTSAVRLSYARYLDELGEIPSTFTARMHTKINEKLLVPLSPAQHAEIVEKVVDNTVSRELLAIDVLIKQNYLHWKALLQQGQKPFREAVEHYTDKELVLWLDEITPESQLRQYARFHFDHAVSPVKPIGQPNSGAVGGSDSALSLGPLNSAIESEFLNDLNIPCHYTHYKPLVDKNIVFENFDVRYLALYHHPLKVGDQRLVGTRFEKLDGRAIRELNGMAAAFGKNIEDLNTQAYREVNTRKVITRYKEKLVPYDQLICQALNSMKGKYVYENKVWKVAETQTLSA